MPSFPSNSIINRATSALKTAQPDAGSAAVTFARPRRLRSSPAIRELVQENRLRLSSLIYPLFVAEGCGQVNPVPSMPGIAQFSVDKLLDEVEAIYEGGIKSVLLFGIPAVKDKQGSGAWRSDGIVQKAIREIKKHFPELIVIADTCLCEYTDHGHCGVVEGDKILNDPTLILLANAAVAQAEAGADMVAPSDMMDGRVKFIRQALDEKGFDNIPIMSYSAKFASSLFSPFRQAAECAPQFGDRQTYQMDPSNKREALKEIALDIQEGTDIVLIKPALSYLDIINEARYITNLPIAAYNVSGEYAMVKAAAANGWIDERRVVLETLTGIVRAGADLIITYHAKDLIGWLSDKR